MFRLVTLALVLVASGCATQGALRTPQPLAHKGDEPVQFSALGAKYLVPARLAITDHDKKPGTAWLEFTDQHNGCTGGVIFLALGDRKRASEWVEQATKEDMDGYRQQGVQSTVQPTTELMLGEKADVRVAQLTTTNDKAAKAHFGVYVSEQQLFVTGNVFCEDPAFMEPALRVVAEVVSSQQVVTAPQVVAR